MKQSISLIQYIRTIQSRLSENSISMLDYFPRFEFSFLFKKALLTSDKFQNLNMYPCTFIIISKYRTLNEKALIIYEGKFSSSFLNLK